MQLEKKECTHIAKVLSLTQNAIKQRDSLQLKALSNKTIHDSCNYQDAGSITTAVMIYAISKLVERHDYKRIKNWPAFVKKFNSVLDLAIKALSENKQDLYQKYIQDARKVLTSHSVSLKPYIADVLKKAAINKGSKVYEHGISLEKTANLLGVSQWELSDYVGQRTHESKQNQTINVKTRAKTALAFFGGRA